MQVYLAYHSLVLILARFVSFKTVIPFYLHICTFCFSWNVTITIFVLFLPVAVLDRGITEYF